MVGEPKYLSKSIFPCLSFFVRVFQLFRANTQKFSQTSVIRGSRGYRIKKNLRISEIRVLPRSHRVAHIIKRHTCIASHVYLNVSQSAPMGPCRAYIMLTPC